MEDNVESPVMRTAVCHTDGCVNDGVAVTRMLVSTVYCAGCDTFIDDVMEVTNGNAG